MPKTHNTKVAHSSEKQDWGTPPELLKEWMNEFDFYVALDPCTSDKNPLGAKRYYSKKHDGLTKSWDVSTFNPIIQKTLDSGPDIEIKPAVYVNPGYGVDWVLLDEDKLNTMTKLDWKIADHLTAKGNTSYKKLGKLFGIGKSEAKTRVDTLRDSGVIRKQTCSDWVKKAYEEFYEHRSMIVMLLPYRAPRYYFDYIEPYLSEVYVYGGNPLEYYFPLEKRVKFVGATDSAPFDSALLIFRKD